MLRIYGIDGSMSRPACPYDNSCVESFFATLKKEQIYKRKYDTMEEVQRDVFEYIELFYNNVEAFINMPCLESLIVSDYPFDSDSQQIEDKYNELTEVLSDYNSYDFDCFIRPSR